jgi:hypothetical protein
MVAPGLTATAVKCHITTITDAVMVYREKLMAHTSAGEPFSMQVVTGNLVLDTISVIVFGFSMDAQGTRLLLLDAFSETTSLTNFKSKIWNPWKKALIWWKI